MNKKVVVIEDDPGTLEVITIALEKAGYTVSGLSSVISLDLLVALKADCFIIDEYLPYINGHVVCLMLKAREETASTPVILISGVEELEIRAGLCNAEGFLKKPFIHINVLSNMVRLLTC